MNLTTNDFRHRYYLKKNGTKALTNKQLSKLTNGQKNNLYCRISIMPRNNNHEIKLEKGMVKVNCLRIKILENENAEIFLVYDKNLQNFHNIKINEKLNLEKRKLKKKIMAINKKVRKKSSKKMIEKHISKKQKLRTDFEKKQDREFYHLKKKSLISRSYEKRIKKSNFKNKKLLKSNNYISIDPGVNKILTGSIIKLKKG